MRFELLKDLQGNEILAKPVTDYTGSILLSEGTKLTNGQINQLVQHGVFSVYIKDVTLDDIQYDEYAYKLKQNAFQCLPNLFSLLTSGHSDEIYYSFQPIRRLIDYIIDEAEIRTNLFEINKFDNYTYIHCIDTCILATYIGLSMKLPVDALRQLGEGAILHDIGKLKIPNEILNKKGTLTSEEFKIIKKHPEIGCEILRNSPISTDIILDIILHHHEKINGSGYPFGKSGDDLSVYSKIVTVSDVFTALSSNRCYRNRFNPNEAYEYILSFTGKLFDKDVVNVFKNVFPIYPLGCRVKLSNGVEGFVVKHNNNFPDRPCIRVVYESNPNNTTSFYEINLLHHPNLVVVDIIENKKVRA